MLAETGSLPPTDQLCALPSGWEPEEVFRGIYRLSLLKIQPHSPGVSRVWLPHSLPTWLICSSGPAQTSHQLPVQIPGTHGHPQDTCTKSACTQPCPGLILFIYRSLVKIQPQCTHTAQHIPTHTNLRPSQLEHQLLQGSTLLNLPTAVSSMSVTVPDIHRVLRKRLHCIFYSLFFGYNHTACRILVL